MESLSDFKKRIKKVDKSRKHKIRNSLGVYDGYKYYRKNKPDDKRYILNESQYFSIIRMMNNHIAEELSNGNDVKLPCRMGTIELRKFSRELKIDKKGNYYINMPIDWDKTLNLWYEDEEAMKNKILIRIDSQEMFRLYYNKNGANYANKSYYEFSFNKELRSNLSRNLKNGTIDAPQLSRRSRLW